MQGYFHPQLLGSDFILLNTSMISHNSRFGVNSLRQTLSPLGYMVTVAPYTFIKRSIDLWQQMECTLLFLVHKYVFLIPTSKCKIFQLLQVFWSLTIVSLLMCFSFSCKNLSTSFDIPSDLKLFSLF